MVLSTLKKAFFLFSLLIALSLNSLAQGAARGGPYPEEKLEQFVEASKDIHMINQMGEEQMIRVIEREELDVETFNRIAEMKLNPAEGARHEGTVTQAQVAAFDKVMDEIGLIQMQMQQSMENAILESGMEVDEYIELMEAYQTDLVLQQRINDMLRE
jgi:hypothetical protein